jgi:hypothetical protein
MSPRDLARASGVSHGTVYAFIADGSTLAPQRATLDKLRRFVAGEGTAVTAHSLGTAVAAVVARERAASARRLVALIREAADSALGDLDALLVSGAFGGDAAAALDAALPPIQRGNRGRRLAEFGELPGDVEKAG